MVGSGARTRRAVLTVAAGAAVASMILVASAAPAVGAVESGFYFDRETAAVGQRDVVSAVDVGICEDVVFSLSLAGVAISSPTDPRLIHVAGTWHSSDLGDTTYTFTVPQIDLGRYLGYIACGDGTFGPTQNTLIVVAGMPATDTIEPTTQPPDLRPIAVLTAAGLLGLLATWRRGLVRMRPDDRI